MEPLLRRLVDLPLGVRNCRAVPRKGTIQKIASQLALRLFRGQGRFIHVVRRPSRAYILMPSTAVASLNRRGAVFCLWGVLLLWGFLGGIGYNGPSTSVCAADPLDRVRAAARSPLEGVASGTGSGAITRVLGPNARPQLDVRFQLIFSGDKYRIALDFRPVNGKSPTYRKIIAICDGTAIASAMFADGIKPGGCRIQVYEAGYEKGMLATATSMAMFHEPHHLPAQLFQRDILRYDVAIEKRSDGMLRMARKTDRAEYQYVADPGQGFNLVMYQSRMKGDDGILYEDMRTGEWGQQDGVWFLRKLTEEDREDGTIKGRTVLVFDEFQVNPAVSDVEFKWEQLNACAGGIVVDQRPNPRIRAYQNVPFSEDEKRLDTLEERVNKLPPR